MPLCSSLTAGLERIHQVTNTIRIANTGWRIRICIRDYSDSLYSLAHSVLECASEEEVKKFIRQIHVGYIIPYIGPMHYT